MLRALFLATIASIPFYTKLIIPSNYSYFAGLFNEYASFTIHLSDLLLLTTVIVWAGHIIISKQKIHYGPATLNTLIALFIFLSFVSGFFAIEPLLSIFHGIKLIEGYLLYLLVINKIAPLHHISFTLLGSFGFQSLLGIYQFVMQSSLGLHFLGETKISQGLPGLATIGTPLGKIIRAYGTLPHPNILAGGIVITIISAISALKEKKYARYSWILLPLIVALILTMSRTAWLALIAACFTIFLLKPKQFARHIKHHSNKIIALLVSLVIVGFSIWPVIESRISWEDKKSIDDRITYGKITQELIIDDRNIITGVGASNFTLRMQEYAKNKIKPWNFQPVHNIFLLTLAEKGIMACLILVSIFMQLFAHASNLYKIKDLKHASFIGLLVALVIIGSLDHYLLTIQPGFLLFWLAIAIISKKWYRRIF